MKKKNVAIDDDFIQDNQSLICKVCYVFWGILLLVFSVCALIAYYSYNPFDESFNSASSYEIANILGSFGSYTADVFHQYIGKASVFILIALAYYGLKLIRLREFKNRRVFALIISFFALPIFFKDAIYGKMVFSECFYLLDRNFEAPGMYLLLKLSFCAVCLYFYGIDFTWRAFKRGYRRNKALIKVIRCKINHNEGACGTKPEKIVEEAEKVKSKTKKV